MIIIYVDDMMVIRYKESIIDVQERVKEVFSIKTETHLNNLQRTDQIQHSKHIKQK